MDNFYEFQYSTYVFNSSTIVRCQNCQQGEVRSGDSRWNNPLALIKIRANSYRKYVQSEIYKARTRWDGRAKEGRSNGGKQAKTQTRDIYREHSAHAPRITAFPRFRCDISLTLPSLRRFPFSFSLFLPPPLSVVPSRGSAWMEETCRPKNSSHVARRRQAARVARLFRKRICTFEKRGVTREPARWFDKENGRGGCDGERRINVACHRTDREDTRREGLPYASLPTEHFPDGWGFLLPTVSLSPKIFGKRYTFASLFFSFFLLLTFTSNKI